MLKFVGNVEIKELSNENLLLIFRAVEGTFALIRLRYL